MSNQPCQPKPTIADINSAKPLYYLFTASVNKSGWNCNTIDDPYAGIFVPSKVKNTNIKVFNLMSEVSKTRFLIKYESCECKCRLDENACNSKQKWNHNKCWCKHKELDDWSYMCNPSTCDCECNKACKIGEYLNIKNCPCKKRFFGKLVIACKDEILNTTETSFVDKKVACQKNNCLIHTISLIISCQFYKLLVLLCKILATK